ncbi:MAG TPA: hypothetical protein VIH86_08715, partial [Puia sp.]
MKIPVTIILFVFMIVYIPSCNQSHSANEETTTSDTSLAAFINQVKAVDNHAHANTIDADDKGSDALPLDGLGNIELPVRVRPESKIWVDAAKAVYGFNTTELNENTLKNLIDTERNVMKQKAENFPSWALDQAGIEVMFANRITMGAGLSPSRFRWVSYDDALLFPLSAKAEAAVTPDREKLFPLENNLLKKYLADLSISKLPATLDEYLKKIVTATLEAQKKDGCMAVK